MRSRTPEIALLAATMAGGVALGGCHVSRPNPEHCYHARGDLTCAELDPATPYCAGPGCGDHPDGCVAEPPPDECYSPCGLDTLIEDDASCIEVGDGSETSTGTGEETGSDSGTQTDECLSHEDCLEDAAYCQDGTCVPCDAASNPTAACFDLTGGQATICLDGECVECTAADAEVCIAAQLVCDLETHACVPCTTHDQCPGGAGCDLALGECLPADAVWHVDGDGGQDFLTVTEALAAIGSNSATLIIHELEVPGYVEGISVTGDRVLAVFGAEGELPILYMTPVSLEVVGGARVYARRLTLRGQDAALVTGSHVEFDTVSFSPQLMHALRVENSVLRMRNSMLRSTFDPTYPVLDIVGSCDVDIRYGTFLGLSDQAAVSCLGAALVPGSRVRNSILVNLGDVAAVQCASPSYEHNGLEDAAGFVENTSIGDATLDWFVDPLFGDLHLSIVAPVVAATAASWSEGDPVVDFDADPRPAVEGSADFVGADRLP